MLHVSLRILSNCLLIEFFSCWYISTALKLLKNILVEVFFVITAILGWFIKVHLAIVVLFADCLLAIINCMKLNVTCLHLIIVPLVRHGVVWIQNNGIYRVFLFSFLRNWLLSDNLFWNKCAAPLKISLRSLFLCAKERGHAVLNRLLKVLFESALVSCGLRFLLGRVESDSMIC